jgi:hypothetical protein
MEVGIQLHVPTTLPLGKNPAVPTEYKVLWVSDQMFSGREKFATLA